MHYSAFLLRGDRRYYAGKNYVRKKYTVGHGKIYIDA
jgi:hypothetical protein